VPFFPLLDVEAGFDFGQIFYVLNLAHGRAAIGAYNLDADAVGAFGFQVGNALVSLTLGTALEAEKFGGGALALFALLASGQKADKFITTDKIWAAIGVGVQPVF
jgi:hypothetical protein